MVEFHFTYIEIEDFVCLEHQFIFFYILYVLLMYNKHLYTHGYKAIWCLHALRDKYSMIVREYQREIPFSQSKVKPLLPLNPLPKGRKFLNHLQCFREYRKNNVNQVFFPFTIFPCFTRGFTLLGISHPSQLEKKNCFKVKICPMRVAIWSQPWFA